MKKHFSLLVPVCIFLLVTSCKKSYTCECTNSWTNEKFNTTIKSPAQSKAEKQCTDMNAPEVDGPRDCHLVN